jgi:hypothetical protein
VKLDDINIGGHKFAPKKFDVKRIERYSQRGIIIETTDGKLFSATLSHYHLPAYLGDDGLLQALRRMGRITAKEVKDAKAKEKKQRIDAEIAQDLRDLSHLTGKYSIALTSKQMASFKRAKA